MNDPVTGVKLLQKFCLRPVAWRDDKQAAAANKTTNSVSVSYPLVLRVTGIHADSIVRSFVENNIVLAS